MSKAGFISLKDHLIEYLKPLYYHDYHKNKWYTKENGTRTYSLDIASHVCLHNEIGTLIGTLIGNEISVRIMLNSDYVKFEMTPKHLLESNTEFPDLIDALKACQPLQECLRILAENPSTAFSTDKYGNGSLYHIIQRCLFNCTMLPVEYITLFNRILDIVGVVGFPRTSAEERIVYIATSRKCITKYPSFLETLIRRGANVKFVYSREGGQYTMMSRLLYDLEDDNESVPLPVPETVLGLIDLLLCHGADISWRDKFNNNGILNYAFCLSNSDYVICQYLLSKGADFSASHDVLDIFKQWGLREKHELVNRWPTTMGIIVLKEIGLYHHLDCDTFFDLWDFTRETYDVV
jgi:hypothetical protein